MRVTLIGPYPPPYGGISIYIKRLQRRLNEQGIECKVLGKTRTNNKCSKFYLEVFGDIATRISILLGRGIKHFHCSGFEFGIFIMICVVALLNRKAMITFHSLRTDLRSVSRHKRFLIRSIAPFVAQYIAVNAPIREALLELTGVSGDKIVILPAYIDPPMIESDLRQIPDAVWEFMAVHSPVISANASRLALFKGKDLYGIDMCIDLCARLKRYFPRVGLLIALSDTSERLRLTELKKRIKGAGLERDLILHTTPCEFYPIIEMSDVFVRPTNTDGDSVSVREALYFGKPVVASDAIQRPEGTILFRNRDQNDFFEKTYSLLKDYDKHGKLNKPALLTDSFDQIYMTYKRLEKGS